MKWSECHSVVSNSATAWTVVYHTHPSVGFSRQGYWSGVPLPSLIDCAGHRQISGLLNLLCSSHILYLLGVFFFFFSWHIVYEFILGKNSDGIYLVMVPLTYFIIFIYIVWLNTLYKTEHFFVTFLSFEKITQSSKHFKKLFWKNNTEKLWK